MRRELRARRRARDTAPRQPLSPVDKLRLALELFDLGLAMHRQTLRRRHPDASDEPIERRVNAWLSTRPGAEHGDSVGRVRPLPEHDG